MSDNKNGGYIDDIRGLEEKGGFSRTLVHGIYDGKFLSDL
jgi:hypothetical protein